MKSFFLKNQTSIVPKARLRLFFQSSLRFIKPMTRPPAGGLKKIAFGIGSFALYNFLFVLNVAAQTKDKKSLSTKFFNSAKDTATKAELINPSGDLSPELASKLVFVQIGSYINTLLTLLGVVFLLLMIWGGIMWMTAAGNDSKVDKAKKIIISSAIGITIILLSQVITFFILNSFAPEAP